MLQAALFDGVNACCKHSNDLYRNTLNYIVFNLLRLQAIHVACHSINEYE